MEQLQFEQLRPKKHGVSRSFNKGWKAYFEGNHFEGNPYHPWKQRKAWLSWLRGWKYARHIASIKKVRTNGTY